jgi:hypothetical protein
MRRCIFKLAKFEANVRKLYTDIIYVFSVQVRVFVPCKPFQDSIVFAEKAGPHQANHLSGAPL